MKKFYFLLLLFINSKILFSQNFSQDSSLFYTPNGVFDSIIDNLGNKYHLTNLAVTSNGGFINENQSFQQKKISNQICLNSYYELFFEDGWSSGLSVAQENLAKSVICQVFTDLSNFINSPNLNNTQNKVNIFIRDISKINNVPQNVIGLATTFHTIPNLYNSGHNGGISDNSVWKTIQTGLDAFIYTTSPLRQPFYSNNTKFFHAFLALNFLTTNFNLTLNAPNITEFDLYSVVLHEMTHALGFSSSIGNNNNSVLGNNYFTRYDTKLKKANVDLLSHSGSCPLYNYSSIFNQVRNNSTPTNYTDCSKPVKFHFSNNLLQIPTYTPNEYESGSSLSHFEDLCYTPSGFNCPNNNCNDLYFSMSNVTGKGKMKRYLKPEERLALCEIGYSVSNTFGQQTPGVFITGSGPNLNFINYNTPVCQGILVSGINDGIKNGQFIYNNFPNTGHPLFGGIYLKHPTYNSNDILSNDINADGFDNLEIVFGAGNFRFGTNSNSANGVLYEPSFSNFLGQIHLLRYTPYKLINNQKFYGNITYVFINANNKYCDNNLGLCNNNNLVINGSFENGVGAGAIEESNSCYSNVYPSCWNRALGSPDYFVRNNDLCNVWKTGSSTMFSLPPTETYSGINTSNDRFIGIVNQQSISNTYYNEAIQTTLKNSLVAGKKYTLKFKAKVSNFLKLQHQVRRVSSAEIQFFIASGYQFPQNPYSIHKDQLSTLYKPLINQKFIIPNNDIWNLYSITFDFSDTAFNLNQLIIGSSSTNASFNQHSYVFLDDIELFEENQSISLNFPERVCINDSVKIEVNATYPNDTLEVDGIPINKFNGSYNFIPSVSGKRTITYKYSDANGCINKIMNYLWVDTSKPNLLIINPLPSIICKGFEELLNSNINGGLWTSSEVNKVFINSGGYVIALDTGLSTIKLKIKNGCGLDSVQQTVSVVDSSVSIILSTDTACVGSFVTLVANPSGGIWSCSSNGSILQNRLLTSNTQGIVNVTYSIESCGRLKSISKNLFFMKPPPPSTQPITYCQNSTAYPLTAIGSNLKWYLNNVLLTEAPAPNTTTIGITTYQVTQTINGCESPKANIVVNIIENPKKPGLLQYNIYFCLGDYTTLNTDSLINFSTIDSSNIVRWFDDFGNIISPYISTNTVGTTKFYAAQQNQQGCIGDTTSALLINVKECVPRCLQGNTYTTINNKNGFIYNGYFTGLCYINSDIIVDGNTIFENAEVIVDSGVSIYVYDENSLTIKASHFFTCGNFRWKGIVVGNSSHLTICGDNTIEKNFKSSLIEDADTAVKFDGYNYYDPLFSSTLQINNTIFNRNNVTVKICNVITDYNGNSPFVFHIGDAIITSRDIPFVVGLQNWPTINTLKQTANSQVTYPSTPNTLSSPFIDSNSFSHSNVKSFLKGNIQNKKPSYGIMLNNIGDLTYNQDYRGITIGYFQNIHYSDNRLIFDNLNVGLDAFNSNVIINNCVFQNGNQGINSLVDKNYYKIDISNGSSQSPNNAFFELNSAISILGTRYVNIANCDIRSRQSFVQIMPNYQGVWGIYVDGTKYDTLNIVNNNITNIANPITINNTNTTPNPNREPYISGEINITGNKILAQLPNTNPIGDEFVGSGIRLISEIMYDENYAGDKPVLNCSNNTLQNVFNGIEVSGWCNKSTLINNNNIKLVVVPNTAPNDYYQHGIKILGGYPSMVGNSEKNTVMNNWVTGDCNYCNQTGILSVWQIKTDFGCNYVEGNNNGFKFYSLNPETRWWDNFMNPSNRYGMTLEERGEIGTQGSSSRTNYCNSNNNWLAHYSTWNNYGNFKTNVMNSNAKNSELWVDLIANNDGLSPYDPSAIITQGFQGQPYDIGQGIRSIQNTPGFNCGRCQLQIDLSEVLNSFGQQLTTDEQIATGTYEIPTADSAQRLYVLQQHLFEKLKMNEEQNTTISSPILNNFMQNNSWSSYDFMFYTSKYLAQYDSNTVNLLLDYFPSNNTVDDNYWQYFSWQAQMMANPQYQPNLQQLFNLANKCPLTNGKVVWYARNMYNRITKKNIQFNNNCDNTLSVARQKQIEAIKRKPLEKLGSAIIYPNPTKGIVNIKLAMNAKDKFIIKVVDIYGKTILEKNAINFINTINLNGYRGIYFVHIFNKQSGISQIEKIILQ